MCLKSREFYRAIRVSYWDNFFPNSDSLKGSSGGQKSLTVSPQEGKGASRGWGRAGNGHAADQLRGGRGSITFHCACGAILIPELNPELNDADPRVDLCCVLQAGEKGGVPPTVNFCRDSLVPVSQPDFGIGNEQKSQDIQ